MGNNLKTKQEWIEFFRCNGFISFPLSGRTKKADKRFQAAKTDPNQEIKDDENYGVIPKPGAGTAVIDLDHKEEYRKFAEENIANGYMVIETGNGWHVYIKGLSGTIKKVKLYNYKIEPTKQIIEIQSPDQYVVGPGCIIDHEKLLKEVTYESKGTDVIWDAKGQDFHHLIDSLCKSCNVVPPDKKSNSSYKHLRDKFTTGRLPSSGQSNDFFNQAALVCNSEGLSQSDAEVRIQKIYDIWKNSSTWSNRPWSNIEAKIREVYDNNSKLTVGRPKSKEDDIVTIIIQKLIHGKKLYSNIDADELYEVKNGFLELINKKLQKELQPDYPELKEHEYNEVIFKLIGLSKDLPPTNIYYYAFKNHIMDIQSKKEVITDEIADMGFPDYNYLPKTRENEPVKFLKIAFDDIPKSEHPRVKAGLRASITNTVDSVISTTYGLSGVGKSTMLEILVYCLHQYAMVAEFTQFMTDAFIRAKTRGKRLLVFQDMPETFSGFSIIKTLTGDRLKTERGFHKDMVEFINKLKIWGSANYLAKIPDKEKEAMYGRRLSLIHNTRKKQFDPDPQLSFRIFKEEGEKIISWIFNLTDEECEYESPETVKKEWEEIAEAETIWLKKNYRPSLETTTDHAIIGLVELFKDETKKLTNLENMADALKELGYVVKQNIVTNLVASPQVNPDQFKENSDTQNTGLTEHD